MPHGTTIESSVHFNCALLLYTTSNIVHVFIIWWVSRAFLFAAGEIWIHKLHDGKEDRRKTEQQQSSTSIIDMNKRRLRRNRPCILHRIYTLTQTHTHTELQLGAKIQVDMADYKILYYGLILSVMCISGAGWCFSHHCCCRLNFFS